ncbi:hypothetical protein LAZ67_20001813 [Cordylochernes scorpioides]|uniref:Retrovirus-related Pol polyprotein from transposon TNT 1-94 n=1 Tax=Cordylochernes scorpioides TaxID=51811 RepID=A0ABY6LPK5_9ARAC|nr:hypothetical protein LAZ67_20001813 [Cordylochernes scorpioides]
MLLLPKEPQEDGSRNLKLDTDLKIKMVVSRRSNFKNEDLKSHIESNNTQRVCEKTAIDPTNRRQRLEWCRARSTWMTEWHRVVFSDESPFCLSSDSRRVRVWRRRGERSNPAAIVERPTVRQRGIMVWGAIAYDSRSPLLRIQGTMTAQRYVDDVLRPVTLPYLQGVPNALYQQDNARPHTARISQQALQDVQMLPWPPYSPDLSPIEHVWDIIGRRLHALPQPRSEDELWQMLWLLMRVRPVEAESNSKRLRSQLLRDYDKTIRPGPNYSIPLKGNVIIKPILLKDLDEGKNQLDIYLYVEIGWNDPRLSWNALEFDNIWNFYPDISEIWVPQLEFTQSDLILCGVALDIYSCWLDRGYGPRNAQIKLHLTWKMQMKMILIHSELWDYANSIRIKPETEVESAEWEKNDQKALATIVLSLSPSEIIHVKRCKTSAEAWKLLNEVHQPKGPATKVFLTKQLILLKMKPNERMQDYLNKFSSLADNLPESYEGFRTAIETRDKLPSFETLKVKMLEEEIRQTELNGTTDSEEKVFLGILLVAIYVDDLIIAAEREDTLISFKESMKKIFKIKDLGKINYCLGIRIQTEKDGSISIDQEKYIEELLAKYRMKEVKPISTPMDSNSKLTKISSIEVSTRPDIAYAVSALGQFSNDPWRQHWNAAKRVLCYLKGTLCLKITYEKTNETLYGYVDADWGGNLADRKSQTGLVFFLAGGPIAWESKKQQTVALSSTESEYIALCEAGKEAVYLRTLLDEMGFSELLNEPTVLKTDNQGAQHLARNPVHHARTKHIDIEWHYIRSICSDGLIEVVHTPTQENVADILTKGLPRVLYHRNIQIENQIVQVTWKGYTFMRSWLEMSFYCALENSTDFPRDLHVCSSSLHFFTDGGRDLLLKTLRSSLEIFRDNNPDWHLYNFKT